jgi:hypothetical protein
MGVVDDKSTKEVVMQFDIVAAVVRDGNCRNPMQWSRRSCDCPSCPGCGGRVSHEVNAIFTVIDGSGQSEDSCEECFARIVQNYITIQNRN